VKATSSIIPITLETKSREKTPEERAEEKIKFLISKYVDLCEERLCDMIINHKNYEKKDQDPNYEIVYTFFEDCGNPEELTPVIALMAYHIFSVFISNRIYPKVGYFENKRIGKADMKEFWEKHGLNEFWKKFENSIDSCFIV
jgi:hypothetical protein